MPYEHLALPDTRGLAHLADTAIWEGERFALVLTPTSCAAVGGAGGDLRDRLSGRAPYAEIAPGTHQSDQWREPRIDVTAGPYGYVVIETDLES